MVVSIRRVIVAGGLLWRWSVSSGLRVMGVRQKYRSVNVEGFVKAGDVPASDGGDVVRVGCRWDWCCSVEGGWWLSRLRGGDIVVVVTTCPRSGLPAH